MKEKERRQWRGNREEETVRRQGETKRRQEGGDGVGEETQRRRWRGDREEETKK